MTKLNFIILEHFLALHPELSDEERAAILALDTDFGQQKDVEKIPNVEDQLPAKIAGDYGLHIFDPEEMAAFLTENHLDYEKLSGSKDDAIRGWRFDLARYLPRHIDDRLVPKILPTHGFPILPEAKLLTAEDEPPAGQTRVGYNLQLYLNYMDEAFRAATSSAELIAKFENGPLQIAELRYSDTPKEALIVALTKDELFWKLIDPLGEGTEEKLGFIRAFRAANMAVIKNGDTTSPQSSTLYFSELKNNWKEEFLRAYAHPKPMETDNSTEKLKISDKNKKRFEAFLLSEDFKSTLYSRKEWPPSLLKSFLKFFNLADNKNARIVLAPLQRDPVYLVVGNQGYKISDIIKDNGYHCLFLEGNLIIGRILQMTTTLEDIGPSDPSALFLDNKKYPSNVEPLNKKEAQALFTYVKKWGLHWDLDPYLPFLCTHGLLDIMAEQAPWLKTSLEQLDRQSAEEALASYCLFENTKPRIDRSGFDAFFDDTPSFFNNLLKNPNPKACLLFFLYQSSISNYYGEFYRDFFPEIFSRLHFDGREIEKIVHPRENKAGVQDDGTPWEEVIIDPIPRALGNLWIEWDEKSLPILADAISRLSDESIRKALENTIDPRDLSLQEVLDRHAKTTTVTVAQSQLVEVENQKPRINPPYGIPKEKFIAALKLTSTQEKIRLLPSENIFNVNLDFILRLELTGPEREDIRRALPAFLWRFKNPSLGLSGEENDVYLTPEIDHGSPQYELLPTFTIEDVLKNGQMHGDQDMADELWAILFSRSSAQALAFFEKLLRIYERNSENENPSLKDTLFFGLKHVLQNHSVASQKLVEHHYSILKTIGNEVDLVYKIDPYLNLNLSQILGDKLKPIATLDPLESANQFGEIWAAMTKASKHSGLFDSISIQQNLTGFLPDAQIEFLCRIFSATESERFDEKNTLTVLNDLQLTLSILSAPEDEDAMVNKTLSPELDKLIVFLAPYLDQLGDKVSKNIWNTYAQVVDERLKNLICDETQLIALNVLGKHIQEIQPIPQSIAVLAAGLGQTWGFTALDKNHLFTENDGQLTLMPSKEIENSLISLRDFSTSDKFQSALAVFLKELHDRYGDFNWVEITPENEWWAKKLGPIFEMTAAAYWDKPPPVSRESAFYYLNILEKEDIRYNKDYFSPLITTLREKYTSGILRGTDSEATNLWEKFLFPERKITDLLAAIEKFDLLNLPEGILNEDRVSSTPQEAQEIQDNIKGQYSVFCYMIKLAIEFKQMGLIDGIPALTKMSVEKNQSPWFTYAIIMAQAASGDPQALEELWLYENGTKNLSSDINGFNEVCKILLSTGKFVLMNLAPEKFAWSGGAGKLSNKTTLGMLELGTPFADEKMQHHWDNPSHEIPSDDSLDNRQHATMVFQTLIGNYADLAEASGKVRTYNLNTNDDIWSALDAQLALVVSDVKSGHGPSVLNLSIGISESVAAMGDAQMIGFLNSSPQIQAIRKKLRFLKQHKIPVCVAAGNEGRDAFNLLGILDPSLILVGSTRISGSSNDRGYHLSGFSGVGSASAHADIATLGEGYQFLTRYETAQDVAGTSFASPQIARLIAQMKELSPNLSVETIQAILKMTSTDMRDSETQAEGAGYVNPAQALYVAFVIGNQVFLGSKQKRQDLELAKVALAEKLSLGNQKENLDWLAKRIQTQVFWQNTFRQGYGE